MTRSLVFKISAAIVLVETLALAAIGYYYVDRFEKEIDDRVLTNLSIPGTLMNARSLAYESVRDQVALERLVGEDLVTALVVRRDGVVFWASDQTVEGLDVTTVLGRESAILIQSVTHLTSVHRQPTGGKPQLAVTSPLLSDDNLIGRLHLVADVSQAESEKRRIVWLFAIGSVLCILVTSVTEVLIVHYMIVPRISQTSHCLRQAEGGDLDARIEPADSGDEIGRLQRGVNKMIHEIGRRTEQRQRAEESAREAQQQLLERQRNETELVREELSKVQGQLVSQTRLATIGQMAASIAHELRNPLGAARNAAYYLNRQGAFADDDLAKYLGIIDQEIHTADTVIRDMLEMARAKAPNKQSVDLGEMVQSVMVQLRGLDEVSWHIAVSPDPFFVHADPGQFRQLLVNVLTNALIELEGEGEIHVRATQDGDSDVITVQDSGPGIPSENRDKVFDPLFTTRAKGTGLGLSICRAIVERHGGAISLVDSNGKGAKFEIRLPRDATAP